MSIDLTKFAKLKKRVEEDRKQKDQAEGALTQLKQQLKREFGCSTIKEAKKLLRTLAQEEKDLHKTFLKQLAEFERKYPDAEETAD